jgi:hypothetical protein
VGVVEQSYNRSLVERPRALTAEDCMIVSREEASVMIDAVLVAGHSSVVAEEEVSSQDPD